MKNNTMMMMIVAAIAVVAVGAYFAWPAKKSEKFTVYRPDPSKNTWAKDAVLTQVLSSGKLV